MKELNFLSKIKDQGKLELVNPSEELKKSYIEKSESNLKSSKILYENNLLEESIALTYYSMYNLLIALLFKIGIKCENHTASIILLKKLFEINNSDIENAKKERIDKQYYTDFKIKQEGILKAIKNAEEFNNLLLDFVSKVSNSDIELFRTKFKELFKQ